MTRAQKQKEARQATAAYAASQPLFDALRIAFIRVGEQKAQLSIARDIVQHLHVKTARPEDGNNHERYIDCAVKAWRSATEIYADVFEALAKATAADAAEGRAERNGHVEFAEMARTASAAWSAAKAFVLYEDVAKADAQPAVNGRQEDEEEPSESDSDDSASESEDAASQLDQREPEPMDATPTNPILLHLLGKAPPPNEKPAQKNNSSQPTIRYSDKIKYDSQGRKILWDRGAEKPNVPYGTLGSSEKKAWKVEKKRQRREKKQQKRAAKTMESARRKAEERGDVEDESKPVNERDYISISGALRPEPATTNGQDAKKVQYEDVSAEIEARLKIKEEKKEASKKEKKRKRESGESEVVANGEVEIKADKPKKKKAKSEDGNEGAEPVLKIEKRSKHERTSGELGEGEDRRKRQKQ